MAHKRLLVLLIVGLVFPFLTTQAQPPDTLWTRIWDYGDHTEKLWTVRAVPEGGYIATGYTYIPGAYSMWTARLDNDGNEIWLNLEDFGTPYANGAYHIEPTSDSGFIQCGERIFPGFVIEAYIRKLDADGNTEWSRLLDGGGTNDSFTCVREVPGRGYVTAGRLGQEQNIVMFNESGDILGDWEIPGAFDWVQWVEPTADGGFIIPSEQYNNDLELRVSYLYKIDAYGGDVWSTDESLPGQPMPGLTKCIREDDEGFIYTCGSMWNGPDNGHDFYVSKRNSDGSVIWALLEQNPNWIDGYEKAYELCLLADGNIAVGGYARASELTHNLWLMKVSSDGEVLWTSDIATGDISSIDQGRDGSIIGSYFPRLNVGETSTDLALIKWEPEVEVDLQPHITIVPETGGWLTYSAEVNNILIDPTPLDAWVVVTGPSGTKVQLHDFPFTIQPGIPFTRPMNYLYVPAGIPDGEYLYEAHLGDISNRHNMGLGGFTFVKGTVTNVDARVARGFNLGSHLPAEMKPGSEACPYEGRNPGHPLVSDPVAWPDPAYSWNPFTGQPFDPDYSYGDDMRPGSEDPGHPNGPHAFTVSAHPNPFNAVSTITLTIPQSGEVRVSVYNTLGQEVARLHDLTNGPLSPGIHQFQLDGSSLSSGVYIVHATVADQTLQQKIVVVK